MIEVQNIDHWFYKLLRNKIIEIYSICDISKIKKIKIGVEERTLSIEVYGED